MWITHYICLESQQMLILPYLLRFSILVKFWTGCKVLICVIPVFASTNCISWMSRDISIGRAVVVMHYASVIVNVIQNAFIKSTVSTFNACFTKMFARLLPNHLFPFHKV
jgi:hypothetical protein